MEMVPGVFQAKKMSSIFITKTLGASLEFLFELKISGPRKNIFVSHAKFSDVS